MVVVPVDVGEEKLALYMDGNLYEQLNKYVKPAVEKKDFDYVLAVDGEEGCQPADSKVLMADGSWKNIQDVQVGDIVLSPQQNGEYVYSKVLRTTAWFCDENYDVVSLNRGHKKLYTCSYNHLIPMNVRRYPRSNGQRPTKDGYWEIFNYPAKHLASLSRVGFKKNTTTLTAPPIKQYLGQENCRIEPYTLGVFLGDGSFMSSGVRITSNDYAILEEINKTYPIMSVASKAGTTCKDYKFSAFNDFSKALKSYGLSKKRSGDKFIPKEALLSDFDYRLRLLAGLIDTDGYYHSGGYSFTLKSRRLIEDIQNLVYSLGGRTGKITEVRKSIKKLNFTGTYYSLSLYLNDIQLPLKVERKIKNDSSFYNSSNRISIDVVPSKPQKVYGFELDSESKLYVTDNWCVTHNSGKSVFSLQIAKILDPNFNVSQVAFTPDEFINLVVNAKKNQCIVFDEAFTGLSSRSSLSEVNGLLVSLMMEMRQKNLFIIIVMPTYYMLDKYVVLHRAKGLFNVHTVDGKRGFWKYWNRDRLKTQYLLGKKFYSYNNVKPLFFGRFRDQYTIDEKAYRAKKRSALEKKDRNTKSDRFKIQRDALIYVLLQQNGMSQMKLSKLLDDFKCPMSQKAVSDSLKSFEAYFDRAKVMDTSKKASKMDEDDDSSSFDDENDPTDGDGGDSSA